MGDHELMIGADTMCSTLRGSAPNNYQEAGATSFLASAVPHSRVSALCMNSALVLEPPAGVAAICIHGSDELHVINAIPGLVDAVQGAFPWPGGIEHLREGADGTVQFKLFGMPWRADDEQATGSQRLILTILRAAAASGAELLVASDVSRSEGDSSRFFFAAGAPPQAEVRLICLATAGTDHLRLIGAPPEHGPALEGALEAAIREAWPKGLRARDDDYYGPTWQLRGRPWAGLGEGAAQAPGLCCAVLRRFEALGYVFHTAADVAARGSAADSLYFRHDPTAAASPAGAYCAVSVSGDGRVRFVSLPPEERGRGFRRIRAAILRGWPPGVQSERMCAGHPELKLMGSPWQPAAAETVHAPLVNALLGAMATDGWRLAAVCNLSRDSRAKCSWVFSRHRGASLPSLPGLLCLSLRDVEPVRVIGGSTATRADARSAVRDAVAASWGAPLESEGALLDDTAAPQMDVEGHAGSRNETDAMSSRSFLCDLVKRLLEAGLRPVATAAVDWPVNSWWVPSQTQSPGASAHVHRYAPSQAHPGAHAHAHPPVCPWQHGPWPVTTHARVQNGILLHPAAILRQYHNQTAV